MCAICTLKMNRILHLTEPGAIGGKSKTFYGSHLLLTCINKTSGTFILSYFNIWGEGVNVVSEFKFEVHNIFNLRTGSIFWWLDMTFSIRWALIWKVQKSPEYSTNTFESSFSGGIHRQKGWQLEQHLQKWWFQFVS